MRRFTKAVVIGGAALVALVALLVLMLSLPGGRTTLVSLGLRFALWQRGFHLAGGDIRLANGALRIDRLRITDDRGELFLSVKHVGIDFDPAGLYGRSDRALGIRRIELDEPRAFLIRHEDGSWNFERLLSSGGAGQPTGAAPAPSGPLWRVSATIAGGDVEVIDPQALVPFAKRFSIDGIAVTASIDQGARSRGAMRATLRTLRGDATLHGDLLEDDRVSFGQATIIARGVPIAPLIDGFAPSTAVSFERGTADIRMQAYTIGYAPHAPHEWHLAGDGMLRSGRLRTVPLAVPVRDLNGRLHFQDGLLSTKSVSGSIAGVPLQAYGAIRLLGGLHLDLAAEVSGDLKHVRTLFAFSKNKPVYGPFSMAVRLDGPPSDIHLTGWFESRNASYAQALIRSLRGFIYYAGGHVTVNALDLAYRGARVWASGDFDVASADTQTMLLVQASSPAIDLPLVANINPQGTASTLAVLGGPIASLTGSGYAQLVGGNAASIRTFFNGDAQGLTLGPLLYHARDGEMMLGASIVRTPGQPLALTGELIASHASLHIAGGRFPLADVHGISSGLPSLDTRLDGVAMVASGADGNLPDVAIDARATRLILQGVDFGDATLVAAGRSGRVHIVRATLRGDSVSASARGDLALTPRLGVSAAVLQGTAHANLAAFAQAAPSLHPSGSVNGAFSAAIFGTGFILGGHASSANASIAGINVRSGSLVANNAGTTTSLLANAAALGTLVFAAGHIGRDSANAAPSGDIAAFSPEFSLGTLAPMGSPLRTGSAVGFATLDGRLSDPSIAAAAVLRSSFHNAPLSGDIDVRYSGGTLRSNASRVGFEGNRATIDGSIAGLGAGKTPPNGLALDVVVHEGDLRALNQFTGERAPLTGSYDAAVRVGGNLNTPQVDGNVDTDIGTIRGVDFNRLHGRVHARPGELTLSSGFIDLGSSRFTFDGDVVTRAFHVNATSPHVDLSDFNDFYGGADVFAGIGYFDIRLASDAGMLAWSGNFDLSNAALHGFPIGYIDADFSSRRGALAAIVIQNSKAGASTLSGTATFRPTRSGVPDPRTARYRVHASLQNVDLLAALPLIHQENLGLTGLLDVDGQMRGTLHNPLGTATLALRDAHLRRMAIQSLHATLSSDAQGVTLTRSDLALPYLTATATGRYTFANERVQAAGTLHAADLSSVSTALRVPGAFGGSATADLGLSGTLRHPLASASVDAARATIYGIAFDSATINATYAPGAVSIGKTAVVFAGNRGRLSITGELPLQLRPLALGPKNRPVEMTVLAEGIDLSVLDPVTKRFATLTGNLNAGASISGTAGNPIGKGTAQIRYASVHSPLDTIAFTDLNSDIGFDRDTITLRDLKSKKGSGSLDAQGAAHIVPAEGLRSYAGIQFWSRLGLHSAQVDVPGWIRGTLDGNVSVTRSGVTPYVEGSVAISNATVPFSAIYALATGGAAAAAAPQAPPGVPPLKPFHTIVYGGGVWGDKTVTLTSIGAPTPAPTGLVLPPVDIKVALTAGNNVRVRGGSAIDLTTAGGLVIAGNLRAPTLDGQFYAVRGQVGYFDTNFRLVSGTVTFDPTAGLLPTMDVVAVTNSGDAEITLHITGRVDNLNTELTSNPPMSRDQIVATLLHAPQLATLSTANPSQTQSTLAQTAQGYFNAQLTRSLLYPFESALAQQLNIESVSFIFDPQGNLAIEVRKRFTQTISAVYQSTLRVPVTQSYGVSYRLRDYLSLDLIEAQPNLALTTGESSYPITTLNLRYQFH